MQILQSNYGMTDVPLVYKAMETVKKPRCHDESAVGKIVGKACWKGVWGSLGFGLVSCLSFCCWGLLWVGLGRWEKCEACLSMRLLGSGPHSNALVCCLRDLALDA